MSVLVLSDSHGLVREVKDVVARHPAEVIFHCGDFCVDRHREPFSRMQLVRGNCDTAKEVPEERKTSWNGLSIYQTHGHLYGVKQSLLQLHNRAGQVGANVVIFGHSHFPVCAVERGILFLNPGSLQMPRGFKVPTYAVISKQDETAEAIDLQVLFYDQKGKIVKERGGKFLVRR